MTSEQDTRFETVGALPHRRRIAYLHRKGSTPGVFWLGGFKSDMRGTKVEALDRWAKANQRAMTRFDYSGHGESGGDFTQGTLSRWLEEAAWMFVHCTQGPQIVVGSSMGAWIALLLARQLRRNDDGERLRAMILLAPAPDFTERLMWARFSPEIRQQIMRAGRYEQPNAYSDEPYIITRQLIEDGRHHLVMDAPIEVGHPVHIFQGMDDEDVPHTHALALMQCLAGDDAVLTLIQGADHRLSREQDISRLLACLDRLATQGP